MNHFETGLTPFDYTDDDGNVIPSILKKEVDEYPGIDRSLFDGITHPGLQDLLMGAECNFVQKQKKYTPIRTLDIGALAQSIGVEPDDLHRVRIEATMKNVIMPLRPEKGSSYDGKTLIYDVNRIRALAVVSWAIDYAEPLYRINWQATYARVIQALGTNTLSTYINNPDGPFPKSEFVVV